MDLELLDNPKLYERRNELDRDALLVSRLPTWADVWQDHKCDEFLEDLPALATDADVVVVLEHMAAHRLAECGGFVRHLCRRLVRRPTTAAAPVLRRLLARAPGDESPYQARELATAVGHAALACDPDHAVPALLASVDTPNETEASLCAVFLSDPTGAFDRVGESLAPLVSGVASWRRRWILAILTADGIPDGAVPARRAANARGFVAADDRWAKALLDLLPDKTLFEARQALANVAPEVLATLRPPRKGKKVPPAARVTARGTVARGDLANRPPLVDVRAGLVMVATSSTSITVRQLAAGLPVVADVGLPGGRAFATDEVGSYDSPFEAEGVLDAVLHPDGDAVALFSHGEVVLVAFDGSIRAEVVLDDTIAHRGCYGAGGATLWVATNDDDGNAVTALDGRTLQVLGRTRNLGEFPDPAWFSAHPHPTDDVGVFAVLCGQDGAWVKVIERTARGFAPRKQKLHTNPGYAQVLGYAGDRAATAFGSKLTLRSWPDLAPAKGTKLDGECRGGVVVGDHVFVAVATFADAPDHLAVYSALDGTRVAQAPWPAGEDPVDGVSGALVTSSDAGVTVYEVTVGP